MGHVADDQAHRGLADVQAGETQMLHIPQLTPIVAAWGKNKREGGSEGKNMNKQRPKSRSENRAAPAPLPTHLEGSRGL